MNDSVFASADLQLDTEDRVYRSRETLVAWLDQPVLVPFLAHLRGKGVSAAAFRREVVTRMVEATQNGDGTYTVRFGHLLLTARR